MHPDQVKTFRQGREAIEAWRSAHPGSPLDLSEADLAGAELSEADLAGAYLSKANLAGANLSNAILTRAILLGADLSGANLTKAQLIDSTLIYAIFCQANLSHANLAGANMTQADLVDANLTDTELFGCQLIGASLAGAELTGAKLYGTARDDWNIKDVKCRYVFWDSAGTERSPRDRDLEPGEFERLYAQLPTIEYVFEHGMTPLDPLVMDRVVQAINEQNPELNLQIDSINARGLQPTIKFTVRQEEQKAAALKAVTQEYGIINAKLEGANEALSGVIDQMIKHGLGGPVNIGSGSMVAIGPGSSINIQEYIGHLEEIEQAIKDAPPETFIETTRQETLDALNGAIRDFGKNKVKEAVEVVGKLATEIGPRLANPTLFQFLKDLPF